MSRISTRSGWLRAAFALALACGLALPAVAQTDVTTSRISGTVTDSNGAALPGVTIEAKNTSASTTLQAEQIKNQPINGRDFKQLVLLTPESRLDSERGNLSISGQRGINTNVTVDGVDYNDPFFGGAAGSAEGRAPLSLS